MRIGIVGAGPSGAYCALRLLHLARERGREVEVHLFDGKSFAAGGHSGCNLCAGLITSHIIERLKTEGVDLGEGLVQRSIRGFELVASGGAERFFARKNHRLYSVFRGGGPLGPGLVTSRSFDQILLDGAVAAGARFHASEVTAIDRPRDGGAHPWVIRTHDEGAVEADMLVGAFGVNSKAGAMFEGLGFGYRLPRCETAFQAEFHLGEDAIQEIYGNLVVIFEFGLKEVRFAALVPKKAFVTLTIIGADPGPAALVWLLRQPPLHLYLPGANLERRFACACRPVLPVEPARNPVGDRVLVIGDAHVARYYKNGIGSAFTTAEHAANAILAEVDRVSLRRTYVGPCRSHFYWDNRVGRTLFALNDRMARSRFHSAVELECASMTARLGGKIVNRALWGLFTGETPYRSIALSLLHPACLFELGRLYVRRALTGPAHRSTRLGPLRDGGRVAIIGGGIGGSSAALALLREAARNHVSVKILLIEPKVFGAQFNQCLGVLSPPILDILENELGVTLPDGMVRRVTRGYRLWSRGESVMLEEPPGDARTVTVRRVELDGLMLDAAEQKGVRVIQSRATGVEIHAEEALVFTDSGTFGVDVVIGAFGLDPTMRQVIRGLSRYVPPPRMQTMVIKVHPRVPATVDRFGDTIEAFLAPVKGASFGAIAPKGDHLSIVLAGRRVTTRHLLAFMELPEIKRMLDFDFELGSAFQGSFPNRPGRSFYGDRFVLVGDSAGLVRPFKGKGITSAVITGIRAAEVIANEGISRHAFEAYARRCEDLTGNVTSGRIVQILNDIIGRTLGFKPFIRFASGNPRFQNALYGAVSGARSYREFLETAFEPSIFAGLATAYISAALGRRPTSPEPEDR